MELINGRTVNNKGKIQHIIWTEWFVSGEFLYTTPGNPPTDPVANGYYSNGTAVFIVSGGLGQITSVDPNGCL